MMHAQTLAYPIRDNLYLNITAACTLHCGFCPKTQGDPTVRGFDLALERNPSATELQASIGDPTRYDEIVFCGYGEPTLRLKVLLEVAAWIKQRGGRVRVNTDGLANLVHRRNVLPEMAGSIDALSVSMNADTAQVYERHCQPSLPGAYAAMLEFLEQAPRYIPEVTATAIEGLDGVDIDACRKIAARLGVRFRARALDVVG